MSAQDLSKARRVLDQLEDKSLTPEWVNAFTNLANAWTYIAWVDKHSQGLGSKS